MLDVQSGASTVLHDKIWLWGHSAGRHTTTEKDLKMWGLPSGSTITPAAACDTMGIKNCIMVVYAGEPEPPFDKDADDMRHLDRVVWSIVGDSGTTRTNDGQSDIDHVMAIAEKYPNICGAMMDDFFHNGKPRQSVDTLKTFQHVLKSGERPLDLWVVLYNNEQQLDIKDHLDQCDVLTFWNMDANELPDLERNMNACVAKTPGKRRHLGIYMWDYGNKRPMTIDQMKHQCDLGVQWIEDGTIEGIIFLASCICDLNLDAVEWTRQWIANLSGSSAPGSPGGSPGVTY